MKFLKQMLFTALTLSAPSIFAQEQVNPLAQIPVETVIVESTTPEGEAQSVKGGTFETTSANVQELTHKLIEETRLSPNTHLVVSTDSPELFAEAEQQISGTGSQALALLADPGALEQTPRQRESWLRRLSMGAKESVRSFGADIKESFHNDPIGVSIVTVTVGIDIFMWVHASQYSVVATWGNIAVDLVVNFGLSLRKDRWAEITTAVSDKVTVPILRSIGFKNLDKPRAKIFVKMLSNFATILTVQAVRLGLVAGGGSAHVLMKGYGYTVPELLWEMTKVGVLVATAFSYNAFGWDNWISEIGKYRALRPLPEEKLAESSPTRRERIGQAAKSVAYRLYEARSLGTGAVITSAALISPTIYGYTSWKVVAVSGTVGLVTYLNKRFTAKVLLGLGGKIVGATESVKKIWQNTTVRFRGSAMLCSSAFSN